MSAPTIVCQLCHAQQPNAWDCAACGHPLHERPALQVEAAPLPELERTAASAAGNVALESLPGLESTALGGDVPVAAELVPGLETTALPPVPAAPAQELPELERTALEAPSAPTPQAAVTCRYCGTPWQESAGRFCPRCGMRVAVPRPAPAASTADEGIQRCPGCGTAGQRAGAICSSCGQRVVPPR